MPFNTNAKASGSKSQSKPPGSKNASKSATVNDATPTSSQAYPMKPSETTSLNKSTEKLSPGVASATPAPPMAKQSTQEAIDDANSSTGVNKKKQKRRQKEAARKAAEQLPAMDSQLAHVSNRTGSAYQNIVKEVAAAAAYSEGQPNGYDYGGSDYDDLEQYEPDEVDDLYYTGNPNEQYPIRIGSPQTNGHARHDYAAQEPPGGKAKKKKRSKAGTASHDAYTTANPTPLSPSRASHHHPPPPPPPSGQPLPTGAHRPSHHGSKDRIWNTSTAQERERIKEFWLSLGEEDRRSLVKVEKEAVLKKMKEQQKHSCSCTVCGRKRTAIEEELEVLYDAYYEELEQYANCDGGKLASQEDGTPRIAQPRMYPHPMAHTQPNRQSQNLNRRSSRGRIQEIGDDEAADDADYSDEEDDEDLSDDELPEEPPREAVDFFNFGKNLTVQGGILTVADDLLKNDGKKFIEMMEQLAERRMQREEEAQFAAAGMGHNHGPPLDDEVFDDEDDEEYDSQEDDEYDEEDEMESMTEVQRMDEGRRMFQIFAARMFEQRVLTAYREKVALERQQKLIEELDDESRIDAQREAKKAKEAQKKKDKKRQQKMAKDEERAKREAEKAAEEASARALEVKKAEELRQKKEEQRKKKEAEKKAQEEEKQRKEAEKLRRLQEAKEQQAEQERKHREQKEREKKKREETKRKEREEREAKEAEAREKKERDAAERKEREAKAKAELQAKEQNKKDDLSTRQFVPSIAKRPSPINAPTSTSSLPPGLHPPHTTSSHASPHLQIATPAVPKAPTPVRQRPTHQESHTTSPKNSQAPSSSTTSPSVSSAQQTSVSSLPGKPTAYPSLTQQSQPPSRYSPIGAPPSQLIQPPGFPSKPAMPANGFPSTVGPPMSPITPQGSHIPGMYSNQPQIGGSHYRSFAAPNGIPFPPGMNGPRQMPQAIARMVDHISPQSTAGGFPGAGPNDLGRYGMSRDNVPSQPHSRNPSATLDRSNFETAIPAQTQPIARPAPIQRPSSVAPLQQGHEGMHTMSDVDDLSNHLGSSALLDDTDVPLNSQLNGSRQGSMATGAPRRQGFGNTPGFPDPIGTTRMDNFPHGMQNGYGNNWPAQQSPFGAPPMSGPMSWSNMPGFGRPNNNAFGSTGGPVRANVSRPMAIRKLVSTACEKLKSRSPINHSGWHHAEDVHREVQLMKPANEAPVPIHELVEICDTEGNMQNGGGFFSTHQDQSGLFIRFEAGRDSSLGGRAATGVQGDVGSPGLRGAMPAIGGPRSFQQPSGIFGASCL